MTAEHIPATPAARGDDEINLAEITSALLKRWKLLTAGPLAAGLLAYGIAWLIPPTFTARAVFLPPQQQQSVAASALASLGALSGLAGGVAGVRTPADQYVALMESTTVADRIIDRFSLMQVYEKEFRVEARNVLTKNTHIGVGKKDGLITVEVDDHSPQRAAQMANRYIDELRSMTDKIAVSDAQQRRMFFEQQLQQTKQKLVTAQLALQSSGVSESTMKADPRATAEAYGSLRAQVTAAEVRLQAIQGTLAEGAPEVRQQRALVASLRQQLGRIEAPRSASDSPDYVSKYREFKYQEALFDIYAKAFESARADESREGGLIQVVDPATPPEVKSKPKRGFIAVSATLMTGLLLVMVVAGRRAMRPAR